MNSQITVNEDKANLRKKISKNRDLLATESSISFSEAICTKAIQVIQEKGAKAIHIFIPIKSELNTKAIIDYCFSNGITVVCPKIIDKKTMKNIPISSYSDLEDGPFSTKQPKGQNEFQDNYDIIFVPALAFDINKNRLGYGAGYYDRFLINQPSALSIGLAFDLQIARHIPTDKFDIPVKKIITEKRLIR